MTKKIISVSESAREQITDYCSLNSVLECVERLIDKYGEGARVDFDSGYNNISEMITYEREETDREYQNRLKKEEHDKTKSDKAKVKKEADERKEYERLKKKYG